MQMAQGPWSPGKAAQGVRHLGSKKENAKIKNMPGMEGGGSLIFGGGGANNCLSLS